jgi:30S ribosomal protein S31
MGSGKKPCPFVTPCSIKTMNYEQNFSGFYIFSHPKLNETNFLNMGKGDKKTRRGKITMKSYGITRPRSKKKVTVVAAPPVEEKPVVKAPVKETKKPAVKKEAKPKKPAKTEEHPKKKEKEKNKVKE